MQRVGAVANKQHMNNMQISVGRYFSYLLAMKKSRTMKSEKDQKQRLLVRIGQSTRNVEFP